MAQSKETDFQKEMIRATKHGNAIQIAALHLLDPSLLHAHDSDGSTPLHCAVWKGHVEVVDLLIRLGANINAHNHNDHWGTTPLHAAAHGNQRAIAEMLIAHGADIEAKNLHGRTPLAETEVHNATAVANLLKKHGARS